MKFYLFALSCLVAVNAVDLSGQSHGNADATADALSEAHASVDALQFARKHKGARDATAF